MMLSLVLGWCLLAGCAERAPRSLGASVEGAPGNVDSVRSTAAGAPVVIQGIMSKKCPVAGCWFVLHDQSGSIKVDTKNAGFVVTDVPLNSVVVVAGRLATNQTERFIDAAGLRY